jgi:adenylate kinase
MKTMFVGGIHGVGKTTTCAQVALQLGIRFATAGDIIQQRRNSAVNAKSKTVPDVAGNQQMLIDGVNALRESDTPLLLDGHFSLLGPTGAITCVDEQVFKDLGLTGIVVFYDVPKIIARRLRDRDGNALSEGVLKQLQEVEISTARSIAKALGIICAELKPFDTTGLISHIRSVFSPGHT